MGDPRMKEIVFVDIDTQYDFMMPKGNLYVQGAKDIIPRLARLTRIAQENGILIIASVDTHIKNDPEFKQFPPHCVVRSRGQKKILETLCRHHALVPWHILTKKELFAKIKGCEQIILQKNTYDIFVNHNLLRILKPFRTAFVYGVALDYCVKYAILGLLQAGLKVNLITDAVRPVDTREGRRLLGSFKDNDVTLVKTKEVLSGIRPA
jgi:nicotinamidase/pyrazinamidase